MRFFSPAGLESRKRIKRLYHISASRNAALRVLAVGFSPAAFSSLLRAPLSAIRFALAGSRLAALRALVPMMRMQYAASLDLSSLDLSQDSARSSNVSRTLTTALMWLLVAMW
jgi:hypothetical protein